MKTFSRRNTGKTSAAANARVIRNKGRSGESSNIDGSARQAAQAKFNSHIFGQAVQRQSSEDEELLQGQFGDEEEELLQGQFGDEEEELLQGKFATQRQEDDEELLQGKIVTQRASSNSTGIPDEVKEKMEGSFNRDFSDVRVHPNSSKAPEVGALAYTQGSDIHFAPGQFTPDTSSGKRLLGHELTHVVQQQEGRVQPTTQVAGMPVNDNPSFEQEADNMGSKAAQ